MESADELFDLDPSLFPNELETLAEEVCVRAGEIFGFNMMDADDVEFEWSSDNRHNLVRHIGGLAAPRIHETQTIPINSREQVTLSNRPFLLDDRLHLHPFTEPGYVAMHTEPLGRPHSAFPPVKSNTKQLILQMPRVALDREAAIYQGFAMDESTRIDGDYKKVLRIKQVLDLFSYKFGQLVSNDPVDRTYLWRTPRSSIHSDLEFFLRDLNSD